MENNRRNNMKIETWINEKIKEKKLDYQELNYLVKVIIGKETTLDTELKYFAKETLEKVYKERTKGTPLSKITQKKHFWKSCFNTNEHTLDPRPETEMLIESISIKPRSVLELGIGTGCLIISILKEYKKAVGLGIDISKEALKVANQNIEINKLEKKLEAKEGNWATGITKDFDLIVSNPPYVKDTPENREKLKKEPSQALYGNIETYKKLIESIKINFKEMLLEVPEDLKEEVEKELKSKGYKVESKEIYNSKVFCIKTNPKN